MTKLRKYLIPAACAAIFALSLGVVASAQSEPEPVVVSSGLTTDANVNPEPTAAELAEWNTARKAAEEELWIEAVNLNKWNEAVRFNRAVAFTQALKQHEAAVAEQARQAREDAERRAAEAKRAASQRSAPVVDQASPVVEQGSGRCGGDLPPCYVMMRESGGNIRAENPSSTASGKWQFLDSTWAGFGGYSHASYAPESVQDQKARILWAGGAGCSHWSAC